MRQASGWADRFHGLQDVAEIRRRALRIPMPLAGLNSLSVETACSVLKKAFDELFVPTEQTDAIMLEIVDKAIAHSSTTYTDSKAFLFGAYAKKSPLPEYVFPISVLGPAGVGKSHLLTALQRILPRNDEILVDANHPKFPLSSHWNINVRDRTTLSGMFHCLLGEDGVELNDAEKDSKIRVGKSKRDIPALLARCRRIVFTSGVSLLVADEFQFATRSESANTLVTSMLLHLSSIGIPMIYAANYSLGHRLSRRPQEDRQRLLSRPLILLPDTAESEDWNKTLKAYKEIAPDNFKFDIDKDARTIHGWTGALKRLLGILLIDAYRRSRNSGGYVTIAEIESAYKSYNYSANRMDINLMNQQLVTGKCARQDLWCPFELPKSVNAIRKKEAENLRLFNTGQEMVKSAMLPEERRAYDELQRAASASIGSGKAKILRIKPKAGLSVDDLRRGEAIFQEDLK